MLSFVVLASMGPEIGAPLRRVVTVDLIASLLLLGAVLLDGRTG